MKRILVCDDDKEIVDAIEIYLQQEGYCILKAYDGEQALRILKEQEVHLLIIDVMMPRLDGIRATLKIREDSSIPIIILSAKSEDADKILGLNIGADDYVTKPFNPLELVARVKSQLRRYTQLGNATENNSRVYQVGGLIINDDLKEVVVDDEAVKLTPIEYNILLLLVKNQGKVFSINQIYESIWNEDAIGADNTVAVHIRHIREKIEINPKEPRYLKVVWGVGYKIEKAKSSTVPNSRKGGAKMAKKRYSIGMKVIAIAAQLVFAVILALMLVVLSALLQKNILDFGDLKNKSFESSSYFSTKFLNVTEEIFHFIDLRRKFETDGNYDDAKLVDVRSYFNNRQLNRGVLG